MQIVDQNVLEFFVHHRVEWLSFVMLSLTYAGGYLIASMVTLFSILSFYIHKQTKKILPLLLSIGGSSITVFILKHIFERIRPDILKAIYIESGYSLPSGHATTAIALYGFLMFVIWSSDKHYLRNPGLWGLSILILLVGASRLYLGVHYFSDVLIGFFIGFVWLMIAVQVSKSKF